MSSSTESVVLVSAVLHAICGQGGDEFEVLKPNEILERVEFMTKAISTSRTDDIKKIDPNTAAMNAGGSCPISWWSCCGISILRI